MDEPRVRVRPRRSFVRDDLFAPRRPLCWLIGLSTFLIVVVLVSGNALLPFERLTVLRGEGGSKAEFLDDPEVEKLLLGYHERVEVTRVGSRGATRNLDGLDFIFPSGQPAATLAIERRRAANRFVSARRSFVSPIVLATFRPYAAALARAGVATPQRGTGDRPPQYYDLDLAGFVGLINDRRTWDDVGIGQFGVNNGNAVLARTSDVCQSNSGATYLALVSYAMGGEAVPKSPPEAVERARRIAPLLRGQGAPLARPEGLYFAPEGQEIAPVVVMYEHQYLAHQLARRGKGSDVDTERVLLYPNASVQTEPTLIALTPEADQRLGEVLDSDPGIQERALELGFRVLDPDSESSSTELVRRLDEEEIPVPTRVTDTTGTTRAVLPAVDELEAMITTVGNCGPS